MDLKTKMCRKITKCLEKDNTRNNIRKFMGYTENNAKGEIMAINIYTKKRERSQTLTLQYPNFIP